MTASGPEPGSPAEVWGLGDYRQLASRLEPASQAVVAALELRAGARVLDIAAGTGNAALLAARAGAAVTAVDVSPRMVELGRGRTAAEGLDIDWRVGDALALPLADGSVDVAMSVFGVIVVPRPVRVVAELARVLRPGGRLGLACWAGSGYFATVNRRTREVVGAAPDAPDPFGWGSEAELRSRLDGAFAEVAVDTRTLPWSFPSLTAAHEFSLTHSPMHVALARQLGPEGTAALCDEIDAVSGPWVDDQGRLDAAVAYLVTTGRRR